jgi:hypothetical protein
MNRLAEVYTNRRVLLIREAIKYGFDEHEAEDLVQTAFTKACEKLGELRDATAAYGWVSQILKNACLDRWRKKKERIGLPEDHDGLTDPIASPADGFGGLDLPGVLEYFDGRYADFIRIAVACNNIPELIEQRAGISREYQARIRQRLRQIRLAKWGIRQDREFKAAWKECFVDPHATDTTEFAARREKLRCTLTREGQPIVSLVHCATYVSAARDQLRTWIAEVSRTEINKCSDYGRGLGSKFFTAAIVDRRFYNDSTFDVMRWIVGVVFNRASVVLNPTDTTPCNPEVDDFIHELLHACSVRVTSHPLFAPIVEIEALVNELLHLKFRSEMSE